jgi:hypothetical protein
MAGVFGLIKGPQRQLVGRYGAVKQADPRALELQAAMEILAEVFRVRLSDVDEMIQNRFEASQSKAASLNEDELWPREFWLSD